ncbi:MAG: hypothetical protein JNN09_02990 [Alphaproteobacteria bacterium]|nr:hypothetical protein [Alphaproteobacteria bacterium]
MFEEVSQFYKRIRNGTNHRYCSWEHCYNFFQSNERTNYDLAALNLGFYLASWGMYRGSSFLLQKDYKVHVGAVKIIQDKEYGVLRGISLEGFTEEKIDLLFGLIEQLREYYNEIKFSVLHLGNNNDTTDTLITKALMGTLGCIPAYDRFFIKGINESAELRVGLNKENFKALLEWCKNNPVPDNIRQDIPAQYPIMKIIDMYFWRIGEIKLTNDAIAKANEELGRLGELNSPDGKQRLRKKHLEQKIVQYQNVLHGK